jgi:biotin operon repressor
MVWLTIASLTLHGFCYVFFFVVAFIYTDMVAPPDIRSSAQALINVAVLGMGLLIGAYFSGWLKDVATVKPTTLQERLLVALFPEETSVPKLARNLEETEATVRAALETLKGQGLVEETSPGHYWLTASGERLCIERRLITNYRFVFAVPAVITVLCAICFAFLFREDRREAAS